MKVKDFIETFTGTIDVYDNYTEELGISYCGEKLTKEGEEHFKKALNLEVDHFDTDVMIVKVVDEKGQSEKEAESRLRAAKDLFESMAGYCDADDWDRWFTAE